MQDTDRLSWLRVPTEDELPPEVLELWQPSLEKLGFVPNVLRLYALRPSRWQALPQNTGPERGHTDVDRELESVAIEDFAHGAALRKLTKDPALADAIAADHTTAPLEPRVRAMLDYALALTRRPATMTEDDVVALRDAGWSDEDVMDIAEVTGLFNMSNRMASGLGWAPNPEYESLGR